MIRLMGRIEWVDEWVNRWDLMERCIGLDGWIHLASLYRSMDRWMPLDRWTGSDE